MADDRDDDKSDAARAADDRSSKPDFTRIDRTAVPVRSDRVHMPGRDTAPSRPPAPITGTRG